MKKQILSIGITVLLTSSCISGVYAQNDTPTVLVNGGEIFFDDQTPVILGEGTTLVPARDVFEAMSAKVDWIEDTRTVEVTSYDNKTLVRIVLDDKNMKVYDLSGAFAAALSGQDFTAPCTEITLDVAPQIINDRTMIPLRAISEALNADVDWNSDEYSVYITTTTAPDKEADLPSFTLSAENTTVEEGEEAVLYINATGIPEDSFVASVTATVKYDPTSFEFTDAELVNGDIVVDGAMKATNPEFEDGYLKAVAITIDADKAAQTDGKVMKIKFKSLNGEKGAFKLSAGYQTRLGYNTSLSIDSVSNYGEKSYMFSGDSLLIDQTEIVLNAE